MSQPELNTADYYAAMPEGVAGYVDGVLMLERLNQAMNHASFHGHLAMRTRLRQAHTRVLGYLADHEKDAKAAES